MDPTPTNSLPPPTRSRKRKTTSGPPAAEDDKKRAQNRVAQKSFRDKQQSRLQYLESFVDAIKTGQAGRDDDSRYETLLRSHLELLEENRQLKDSLIGLRQKLAYIGQSASAAAEDSAFDSLLKDHGSERGNAVTPPANQVEPQQPTYATIPTPTSQQPIVAANSAGLVTYEAVRASMFEQGAAEYRSKQPFVMPPGSNAQAVLPTSNFYNHVTKPPPNVLPPTGVFESIHSFSDPFFLSVNYAPVSSKTSFASKVEAACKRYNQEQIIQEIASAGVNVIASLSGLTTYIYGSKFFRCLERILQWRLWNTPESRMAIPEPFRPTPLQVASKSHPIIIDFITWPSIRDQMLVHHDRVDLDLLCQELTLHAVIEVPEKKIAIGVYDYVQNVMIVQEKEAASESTSTCLEDLNWTYLNVPMDLGLAMGLDPAEELIMQELASRMQNVSLSEPQAETSKQSGRPSKNGEEKHKQIKQRGMSYPGIDHMCTWKVSKEFAWKWPILDCSTVISAYDRVSYATASQLLG
ncbi:hypothetical protein EDB81DRAFT_229544 [Dactylonectria macrodidyma]|uniref:BZIP domain-containing protein n=1 Tax=Dactylonectria macrodidyma TaxID=307937 RepID=A0A9P9DM64_9HYPO|nr:hypothetical protein EDB81DRAFT_229544 [Dactylonectria macrodidyma]